MATSTQECSKSSVVRELKIQTIMRYHFSPIRMAKIKKTKADVGEDVKKLESSYC